MKNITWNSNWLKISIFVGFGVLFSASSLCAQSSGPSFFIGPIVGYNGVAYTTGAFGPPNSLPGFENIENGAGGTQFVGVSALIPFFNGYQNFFVVEVIYDSKSAAFTTVSGTSFSPGILSFGSYSATLDYFLLNLGIKHNFFQDSATPSGLGIQICASLGKIIASRFTTVINDTENINARFGPVQNGTSVSNIDGINAFRLAIRFDLTYDIPLFTRMILTPSVGYDAPLTKVDNTDRDWTARSLYGAIALRYAFGAP
jgi:hypothetical protein